MKKIISLLAITVIACITLAGCSSTCKADGCENERVEDSKYCTEHICVEVDCLEGKVGENYCEEHFSCAVEECVNERVLEVNFCADHKCIVEDCTAIKKGEKYCTIHKCDNAECEEIKAGKNYCKTHFACAVTNCPNERGTGNKIYCATHTCQNCSELIVNGSKFCSKHKCSVASCLAGKTDGEYCSTHKAEMEAKAAAEKEANKKKALSKLRAKYDEFDETTWYYPQSAPQYINRKAFYPYIGHKDSGSTWLRWLVVYCADDWIFFDKIIINVDGEKYTKTFEYGEVERDNDYGDVWEYVDMSVSESDKALLKKIANSKKTVVRFEGDQYHYDKTITQNEKYGITDILTAYDYLND